MKGYLAIDQYGNKLLLKGKHPRKALLDKLGRSRAEKMYVDKVDGSFAHIGYIVAGSWYTIYKLEAWEGRINA